MEGFTEAVQEIGYQGVRKGDLIIHSMDGFAGAIGVSDSDGKASPVVHTYRGGDDVDPRFIAYVLRSMASCGYIESLAKGIRERSTSFDARTFANLELPCPPLEEQRRIADFLDVETGRIEDLVTVRKHYQELLDERLKCSLITSFLPEGAADWQMTRLKYLFDSMRNGIWGDDVAGNGQDLVCVRVADFMRREYRADPGASTLRNVPLSAARSRILRSGDILIEKSGGGDQSPVGNVVTFDSDNKSVCSNFVGALRAARDVDPRFACLLLAAYYHSGRNVPYIKQTTGIQNLDGDGYLSQKTRVPARDRQVAIAERFDRELDETLVLRSSIDHQLALLAERRQALITAAVTGQIDITTARGLSPSSEGVAV